MKSTPITRRSSAARRSVSADDLIAGWQRALAAVKTQHLLGPIDVRVTGAVAVAECHVRAWHYSAGAPGGEEWVVAGHYVLALVKKAESWTITGMKLETLHQTGNLKLLEQATK
jgi:hypothetical protein